MQCASTGTEMNIYKRTFNDFVIHKSAFWGSYRGTP